MACFHGVVTFLGSARQLEGVDKSFRQLVEFLNRIPNCASFGVSCAGHFSESPQASSRNADQFRPSPYGHLNIAVVSTEDNARELLTLLEAEICRHADASLKRVEHVFGPPKGSAVEIWEIRIGSNGSLKEIDGVYHGGYINKNDHPEVYQSAKCRYQEITDFWSKLEGVVGEYCQKHDCGSFDPQKRIEEICSRWK